MILHAWHQDRRIGTLSADGGRVALTEGTPELAEMVQRLQAEPYLPLTIRRVVEGHREVTMKRLPPGDPDYWQALAEALNRKLGVRLTPG